MKRKSEEQIIKEITDILNKKGYQTSKEVELRDNLYNHFIPDMIITKNGKTVLLELKDNEKYGMIGAGATEIICDLAETIKDQITTFVLATSAAVNPFEKNVFDSIKNIKQIVGFNVDEIVKNIEQEF